ncbi:hypothetical protein C6Q17_12445 [Burkholderia contaminans]|nr:hypothetical protein C6Q17_12445 [Burkholderia contaminans]
MHSVFPCCWQHRMCRGISLTKSVKRPSVFFASCSRPRVTACLCDYSSNSAASHVALPFVVLPTVTGGVTS